MNQPFAEIIESSLSGLLAQTWKWDQFPSFGSLVTIESNNRKLYGLVHQIQTGSMDPMRYPFPYQKTQEELLREQPQIFEFLKTTFHCLIIGYKEKGSFYYQIAPEPAKIHSFVYGVDQQEAKEFFQYQLYLHTLFSLSNQLFNVDELLLALLKYQKNLNILHQEYINQFLQDYSLLTGNDYRRMKLFTQRMHYLID